MAHGYTPRKEDYLVRLRRIEGQVRGLQRLIEDDTYCIDVLTQISAVRSALNSVAIGLAEDHIGHCVIDAAKQSDEAGGEKVAEVTATIARLVKS
ncbi:MAG: metal-sensitive transcriptional regulator [Actinomycetaceae bacterium]|nr:metal-sensitive transcriptional regulator [Actinomycetaceae bacterium]